ncbi:hypothetical protein [Polymorphospora rubra]|uniref:Uncharacterized protein n=1 Tax=Polymorphospora rubra TaxID=338584 RepID=A0A810MX21_9ACTN|nr:hypothetical protein [Polymorphospora rubra]BCJ64153.1 hypothetical protein Prubr_11740 [Polymorphospora rubra]
MTWEAILAKWPLLEADMHEVYGVDLEDRGLLRSRSWRWWKVRVQGLLAADTRLHRALSPRPSSGA